jgi:hypothetical protein
MRTLRLFAVVIGGLLFAAAAIEAVRWRVSGDRSNWVTLKDPGADTISVAEGPEAFLSLLQSAPSPAWASARGSSGSHEGAGQGADAGRVVNLPKGTHAEVIDRGEFDGHEFRPPTPGSIAAKRSAGMVEALEVRVRDGTFKGTVGWTLPDLMQHDVAWP